MSIHSVTSRASERETGCVQNQCRVTTLGKTIDVCRRQPSLTFIH